MQKNHKNYFISAFFLTICAFPSGCAKDDGTTGTGQTSTPLPISSSIEGVAADLTSTLGELEFADASLGSCTTATYAPVRGSANCVGTVGNKTVTSNFNSCVVTTGGPVTLTGTSTLDFDAPATCNTWINSVATPPAVPTSGTVTRTTTTYLSTASDGDTVSLDSTTHANYLGDNVTGGVRTTFGVGTRTVDVLGLHRIGKTAAAVVKYDQSVRSTAPLIFSGSRTTNDFTLQSGVLRVDSNDSSTTKLVNATNLIWGGGCCYPTSGSMIVSNGTTQTLLNSVLVMFDVGCNRLRVFTPTGSVTTYTLPGC